ncbi:MAG: hypothetical protein CSA81_09925 [Acidobacteria bacterium]|nr:MAG: hypothetical protein CSA81_09925 [Acidobacteriota bacterium]
MKHSILAILLIHTWGLAQSDRGVLVRATKPELRTLHLKASYPLEILPYRVATLAAEWNGPIVAIDVEEFERVKKGQALSRIDTRILEYQIQEAEANYQYAEKQLKRYQGLHERKAVTEQALLEVELNHQVAEVTLNRLKLQHRKATTKAPWSGIISKKTIELGDFVTPGQPLYVLLDDTQFRGRASVSGKDASLIKKGLPARVSFQNIQTEIEVVISKVAPAIDPETRNLEVEVVFDGNSELIRPGMVAELEIEQKTMENAMCIPLSSILEFEDGKGVYLAANGKAIKRMITPGEVNGDKMIVLSGLSPDDHVIVEGQNQISNGTQITMTEEEQ